ncbi:unnamed protein product [Victoria cruziana]
MLLSSSRFFSWICFAGVAAAFGRRKQASISIPIPFVHIPHRWNTLEVAGGSRVGGPANHSRPALGWPAMACRPAKPSQPKEVARPAPT